MILSFMSLSIPGRKFTVRSLRNKLIENVSVAFHYQLRKSSASTVKSFQHAVFSFPVINIMYSLYTKRFWFSFVQKD